MSKELFHLKDAEEKPEGPEERPEGELGEMYEGAKKHLRKDVRRHVIFGPKRLKDKHWDIFLMTLEYGGQKIDLAGAYSELIRGEKRKRWVLQNTHFDKGPVKEIYGIRVHVARKKDLIAYKKELSRPVDKIDVREIS